MWWDTGPVDGQVPAPEQERYRAWLASPPISAPDSTEMRITWNLASRLGLHPTRVLRSLRGERGYLAGEMEAVLAAVAADPDLVIRRAGVSRRVDFRTGRRWRRTGSRASTDR